MCLFLLKSSVLNKLCLGLAFIGLVAACAPVKTSRCMDSTWNGPSINTGWFSDTEGNSVYHTRIRLREQFYSGMLVVRSLNDSGFRVAFVTGTGIKILDWTVYPARETEIHYLLNGLDRKVLIRTLDADFHLLFGYYPVNQVKEKFCEGPAGEPVRMASDGWRKGIYQADPVEPVTRYAFSQAKGFRNSRIHFFGSSPPRADSLHISHTGLPLDIRMRQLKTSSHAR